MRSLVSIYQNSQILVLGGEADNCRKVAEGFVIYKILNRNYIGYPKIKLCFFSVMDLIEL